MKSKKLTGNFTTAVNRSNQAHPYALSPSGANPHKSLDEF